MSSHAGPETTVRSDAELIAAVRSGDLDAYGHLFERHRTAAVRLARQLTTPSDADDLVSDAFAKVLTLLQRGGGPDVAFRAYLLTAVRRLHVDQIRSRQRTTPTDEPEVFDPGVPFTDPALAEFESSAAAKAFAALPERWQLVLWHLEVEGHKPADIAPMLGISANSVSALAYRAREGLRQSYLQMHLSDTAEDQCRWVTEHMGARVRNGLSKRETARVDDHLKDCARCSGVFLELSEVNSNLSGIIAPALLGTAAAGYLATTSGGAAAGVGVVLLWFGKAKDFVVSNSVAVGGAAAGVVAVAVAATALVMSQGGGTTPSAAPITSAAPASSAPTSQAPARPAPQSQSQPSATPPSTTQSSPPKRHDAALVEPPESTTPPASPPPSSPSQTTAPPPPPPATAPSVQFTIEHGSDPRTVTVDASQSTVSVPGQTTYIFDFGDGSGGGGKQPSRFAGLATIVVTENPIATHTYTQAGTYHLSVTVVDADHNRTTRTRTISITGPTQSPPPANEPPVAAFSAQTHGLKVSVDASKSSDVDGRISSYAWDFGDGATATGKTARAHHQYGDAGDYRVTLTVTDNDGDTSTVTHKFTINQTPTAAFTATPDSGIAPLTVTLDAGASTDPDNDPLTYQWDFGDGNSGSGGTTSHTYATAGDYTVTLTVTDKHGATDQVSHQVSVTKPEPPVAEFSANADGLNVMVNAELSYGTDGDITSYAWDFGDNASGSGKKAHHTYEAAGDYTITLTVTDNRGNSTSTSRHITVTNTPPIAEFTIEPETGTAPLKVTVNAADSHDPDGTIISYTWDFGHGKSETGETAHHTYAHAGCYSITLKVADNNDAEGEITHQVTVTEPEPPNEPPVAKFTIKPETGTAPLQVTVNAADSHDPDGTITNYTWHFEDSASGSGSGKTAHHTYQTAGDYTITLTVTDDDGDTSTVSHDVKVTNNPPTAEFTACIEPPREDSVTVFFDASDSTDPDGHIVSYDWKFGDGAHAKGKTTTHKFDLSKGIFHQFTATLTVTDNAGASARIKKSFDWRLLHELCE